MALSRIFPAVVFPEPDVPISNHLSPFWTFTVELDICNIRAIGLAFDRDIGQNLSYSGYCLLNKGIDYRYHVLNRISPSRRSQWLCDIPHLFLEPVDHAPRKCHDPQALGH